MSGRAGRSQQERELELAREEPPSSPHPRRVYRESLPGVRYSAIMAPKPRTRSPSRPMNGHSNGHSNGKNGVHAPPSGGVASHARASPAAMKTLPELPSAVTGVLADAELADPNGFSEEDENVFLATVAVGAGGLFLLPIFPGILADVVCSTLIGGGAAAYCALLHT